MLSSFFATFRTYARGCFDIRPTPAIDPARKIIVWANHAANSRFANSPVLLLWNILLRFHVRRFN